MVQAFPRNATDRHVLTACLALAYNTAQQKNLAVTHTDVIKIKYNA